ncbi:UDP-4-amino-4,6-dideoxy-N-acetyl-beta-L-altrosamine transaminase [Candidatus Pacearchaeota archaeon]|nr:UDP-4-amino-4,6-dideoxy-N-acetyl-beta-L-altrosamine transaminase [Candidatus Pacearchaeota archaeon]|tara:strand:- start:6568 stop:7689 length:1122 start_codon:yes stop_codon:yes gene_type:complete
MEKKIPYQKQFIDDEDISAVVDTLKRDFITGGPKIEEFEKKFSEYVGAKYGVAVANGTAGLHIACLAAGLKEGDELITSPITFLASANCALYCKSKVRFIDIDSQGLLDLRKINFGEETKVVIPVHYGGMPLDLKGLRENFKGIIIEDACHALGAEINGEKIGNCKYSDICVFSFHPVKHITTGEGGMITTNNEELYKKLLILGNHGVDVEKKTESEPWATPMTELGFNYRITDFQCALGISQLKKIDSFVKSSREIAKKYETAFSDDKEIEVIKEKEGQKSSYHLYPILVKDKETRLKLYNYLRENGIFAQIHYQPVYLQPYYRGLGYSEGECPVTESFYNRVISLPIYPTLTDEEQLFVINKVKEFFKNGI